MGRSRGGLTTKIHALVDADGLPIDLRLSEGQHADCRYAEGLLQRLRTGTTQLAYRGYDTDAIRDKAAQAKVFANIPAKRNRTKSYAFSAFLYRYRDLVECFFNRLKRARGMATRYDKRVDRVR